MRLVLLRVFVCSCCCSSDLCDFVQTTQEILQEAKKRVQKKRGGKKSAATSLADVPLAPDFENDEERKEWEKGE